MKRKRGPSSEDDTLLATAKIPCQRIELECMSRRGLSWEEVASRARSTAIRRRRSSNQSSYDSSLVTPAEETTDSDTLSSLVKALPLSHALVDGRLQERHASSDSPGSDDSAMDIEDPPSESVLGFMTVIDGQLSEIGKCEVYHHPRCCKDELLNVYKQFVDFLLANEDAQSYVELSNRLLEIDHEVWDICKTDPLEREQIIGWTRQMFDILPWKWSSTLFIRLVDAGRLGLASAICHTAVSLSCSLPDFEKRSSWSVQNMFSTFFQPHGFPSPLEMFVKLCEASARLPAPWLSVLGQLLTSMLQEQEPSLSGLPSSVETCRLRTALQSIASNARDIWENPHFSAKDLEFLSTTLLEAEKRLWECDGIEQVWDELLEEHLKALESLDEWDRKNNTWACPLSLRLIQRYRLLENSRDLDKVIKLHPRLPPHLHGPVVYGLIRRGDFWDMEIAVRMTKDGRNQSLPDSHKLYQVYNEMCLSWHDKHHGKIKSRHHFELSPERMYEDALQTIGQAETLRTNDRRFPSLFDVTAELASAQFRRYLAKYRRPDDCLQSLITGELAFREYSYLASVQSFSEAAIAFGRRALEFHSISPSAEHSWIGYAIEYLRRATNHLLKDDVRMHEIRLLRAELGILLDGPGPPTRLDPGIKDFTGSVVRLEDTPLSCGGFCDIWKGHILERGSHTEVAMKVFRVTSVPEKAQKRFRREAKTWSTLNHPHILAFLGTCVISGEVHMLSLWQNNGNIVEYLRVHDDANRRKLILQVAMAVKYLHDGEEGRTPIIHGDIKGENVLIDKNGDALLADFGLATLLEDIASISSSTADIRNAGSIRFMAPELLQPEDEDVPMWDDNGDTTARPTDRTRMSDIYAFGQLIFQVVTGQRPFPHVRQDTRVVLDVLAGKHNTRSPLFEDDLWSLCLHCWRFNATERPSVADVIRFLEQ